MKSDRSIDPSVSLWEIDILVAKIVGILASAAITSYDRFHVKAEAKQMDCRIFCSKSLITRDSCSDDDGVVYDHFQQQTIFLVDR